MSVCRLGMRREGAVLCETTLSGWHVPHKRGDVVRCRCGYVPSPDELRELELVEELYRRQELRDRVRAGLAV